MATQDQSDGSELDAQYWLDKTNRVNQTELDNRYENPPLEQFGPPAPSQEQGGFQGLPSDNPLDSGITQAPRALSPQEMTPPLSQKPEDILARQLFGPDVKLSYWDRVRMRDAGVPQMANAYQQQRMMLAQHLSQVEEQARQHDLGLLEKVFAGTQPPGTKQQMLQQLGENPHYRLAGQARQLSKAMKESDYDSFDAYKQFIPQDVQDKFLSGKLPAPELAAWMDHARESFKVNAKEEAKSRITTDAMNTPIEKQTPYQKQLVEEHQAKTDLQRADIELKQAQANKANKEAQVGPANHSTVNYLAKSMFGGDFDNLQQPQQAQVMAKYATMRPEATMTIASQTPVGQTGKAQEFRDPVSGKAAPSWATPEQLQRMGFVNIEPGQANTIAQSQTVEQLLKEITSAGSALTRKAFGTSLADVPLGILQQPLVNLITKYAGDPNAAVLQSALTRLGPVLGRMAGDTHISNIDQQSYKEAIFSPTDTVESLLAKIKSITTAQTRVKQSMGFLPDEEAYVRQLVIRGLPDEQIKAILEERKRSQ